jgi:hypothetical protein
MSSERAFRAGIAMIAVAALSLLIGACGGDEDSTGGGSQRPAVSDPGPIHVHGLGVNPRDGALFIATHTGLFRTPEGQGKAKRVGDRFQDTMGFTVIGSDRFLGSGHPDGRDRLPPFLGLIRSEDAGGSWQPVSLMGERDFHVLEATGRRVYGFGSDFETREQGFLVSDDGGKRWDERDVPQPLFSLAISPQDPDRVVASGEGGLSLSEDAGRRWQKIGGPAGLVAWTDRLVVVDLNGSVHAADDPGGRLRLVGEAGGQPAALDSGPREELYVALHDGTIKRSGDGGRSWSVRSTP